MAKKVLSFIMAVLLVITGQGLVFAGSDNYSAPPVVLGEPLSTEIAEGAKITCEQTIVTAQIDGKDYFFSALSGEPAVLVVYNLDDKVLVDSEYLADIKTPRDMLVDSKGNIYITGDGALSRYNPTTKEVKNFGKVQARADWSYSLCEDKYGNIYVGTHHDATNPKGAIYKLDANTDTVSTWCTPDSTANYLVQLAYYDGYVYASTLQGKSDGTLYKIDIEDPTKIEEILILDTAQSPAIRMLNCFDGKMVMRTTARRIDVFDCTTKEIKTATTSADIMQFHFPAPREGKTYFYAGGGASKFYSLDINTATVNLFNGTSVSWPQMGGHGDCWVTYDDPNFLGESICAVVQNGSTPVIINPVTGARKVLTDVKYTGIKLKTSIYRLAAAGDKIFLSAYITGNSVLYDIETGNYENFTIGAQAEGLTYYDGVMYFGCYSDGSLRKYDISSKQVEKLAVMGEEQQRPYAVIPAENKIFMGAYPAYGKLGGALSWYDLETKTMTTRRNIVPNQSVIELAYKDGIIYGSTSIEGGTGSTPTETQAKVFMYDVAGDKLIKAFTPKADGLMVKGEIKGCKFAPDGSLWFGAGDAIFSVNMETEKVEKVVKTDSPVEIGKYMTFDRDGYLYCGNAIAIYVVNMKELTYQKITDPDPDAHIAHFAIGFDGNIYYDLYQGTELKRITKTNNATLSLTTGAFDKNPDNQADVSTDITWNDAKSILDVKKGGVSVGTEAYSVTGSALTIKKEYLVTQDIGSLELKVVFDKGIPAEFTIDISDTYVPPVDKTALAEKIAAAGELKETEYTQETWSAMQSALAAAETINGKADATQAEVDALLSALETAVNALVKVEKPATSYTVTFNSKVGSDVVINVTSGSAITAPTAPTKEGYTFEGWYKEATLETAWNFATDVVTGDITLYAKWTQNSSSGEETGGGNSGPSITYYTINATVGEGGKISPQTSTVAANTSKAFTITPDEGYEIADVTVDGNSVGAVTAYTFSNVTSSHTIKAAFKKVETSEVPKEPEYKNLFADVNENHWFYDSIMYVYNHGLMSGVSTYKFNPLENGSRGMIVTILYTLEGKPEVEANNFKDVADGKWYTDAVAWAAEIKIVSGYGNGLFGPDDNITREQMAAIFYNYAKHKDYDLSETSSLAKFTDNTEVSGWASEAMQWMVGSGMMSGKGNNILDPKGTATRAEMASIMQKFVEKYGKSLW